MSGATVSYSQDADSESGKTVLRDVNLDIAPGEKVAIVGRTGRCVLPVMQCSNRRENIGDQLLTNY